MPGPEPVIHVLGNDPRATIRLNAWSYQQSGIVSWNGYQYAAYYSSQSPGQASHRLVTVARRHLVHEQQAEWESFSFEDYEQTENDGHNTISLGLCRADGTVHISFDHHANDLKYRVSVKGLATRPSAYDWSPKLFSGTLNSLCPQQNDDRHLFDEVTYPRFLSAGDDLLLEYRIGKAGSGSDVLWRYQPSSESFEFKGTYLVGIGCNPYPNGLSYHEKSGLLHVSWTNRHFVEYEGHDDPNSTVHKAQAGPNGPENNQDLCYAVSSDLGLTWQPSFKDEAAKVRHTTANDPESGLVSTDSDLVAVEIPRDSGIMNQEGQCIDTYGGFHVLNRDNTNGAEQWKHYYLAAKSTRWASTAIPAHTPTTTGPRGSIAFHPNSNSIFLVLPSNSSKDRQLHILWSPLEKDGTIGGYRNFWSGGQFDGEPLIDEYALEHYNCLSILTTRAPQQHEPAQIVVLDFEVSESQ